MRNAFKEQMLNDSYILLSSNVIPLIDNKTARYIPGSFIINKVK
jgi:hypothetical protein